MELATAAELAQLRLDQDLALELRKAAIELEIKTARKNAEIEATSFAKLVNAIGRDTIAAMARAGPEMQAKLLEGLGLESFLITDGTSEQPISLFGVTEGLLN
eukprot:TRINITY_DN2644_c0_g1_i1.p3 TRINITY_DN2644_c0_g1~~TRINITY_DN2644_c0_g1_i1.p3  ORF type:complete len:103 (+),score=5.19 TRINITY_DN2644_c0_g1_i1:3-311(+)